MYTIMMQPDKELIATIKTTIFEKENGVDIIRFLVPPYYNNLQLTDCIALLKYVTPDRRNLSESLVLQKELYKGYADYRLNVSTKITYLPGDVDLRITFIKSIDTIDDESDNVKMPEVLNSGTITIPIQAVKHPYDINCDGSLEAIDQIVGNIEAKIKELNGVADTLDKEKADDIEEENGQIWVTSNGEKIGDPVPTRPKWGTF